ncbi:hypothetical protein POTOM_003184 [Populus tomentosa]|uniref:ABC transporter domain-containing protein n=1 Tax=Populus tomentosa TaxID=118781 RepID=A0A8X8DLA9_POPTO|nr:hypothetical protein POTOM_003184 [Populus tomentosa]
MIFKGLNLKIDAGKTMALVGPSGYGKSTVIGLIERFYDPMKGTVFIDGQDVKSYKLRLLRSHIALVSQEPTLFAGTIRENIAYGKEDARESEIRKAAVLANAHEFIRGVQLSGGQKQRIALARAIIKDPSILLLDEATSALDSVSESLVQDALEKMMVGRTCVVIAHRLSTIQKSNCISVIKNGKVVEQGSHTELMELGNGGAYYSLTRIQSEKTWKNTNPSLQKVSSDTHFNPSLTSGEIPVVSQHKEYVRSKLFMGERLTKRVRKKLQAKLMTFEMGWFDDDENTKAGSMTNDLSKGGNAIRAVFAILERKSEIEIDPNNSLGTSNIKRKLNIQVELNNVFAYPTRPDQMIFNVLNLKIDEGKIVALVGGAKWISYCTSQSRTTLLARTIRENIAYGREDARESEIRKAAVLATAQQFISGMKDGYDIYCGERGFQLSGGQKQGQPAHDSVSESLVQEALERLMVDSSCVAIAHRLSTNQKSNCIAVSRKERLQNKAPTMNFSH